MENDTSSGTSAAGASAHYVLRLYVSGTTPRSARAIIEMRRICETHLKGRYDLDVIDIYQAPNATKADQIVAVPTLVKLVPTPLRRLIGNLSEVERVLAGLNIIPVTGPAG